MVSPRWSARVMSSLAVWVMDQVKPWFMPSSTVAATIQLQLGAYRIMNGIGMAEAQPSSSTVLRPSRSDSRPATKLSVPLTKPKATTNAMSSRNEPLGTPNSLSASAGTTVRIIPSVKPTRNTCTSWCRNCARLSRIPWR